MDLRIDSTSAIPIYAQVVEQVRGLVASRALRPGDKLPSVRELAVALRVNRNTAAKAYQTLESEGVIESHRGQGCFVSDSGPRWSLEERRRRLERSLDRALTEAYLLGIPPEEIPGLLEIRMRLFSGRGASARKG